MVRESRDSTQVLYVDDDPDLLDLVETMLEREEDCLEISTELTAIDALERLSSDTVDCIVSDYDMPGMNGLEFLETVRERHPDLPFILFTGKGSEAIASDAISAGVTDYLQKEGSTEQYELLANRILNAVERSRVRRDLEESESHMRQAQMVAELGSWYMDVQRDEIWWSDEIYDIFGITHNAELIDYEQFLSYVHPADRTTVDEAWSDALDGDEYEIEHRIVTEDGETRWVLERAEIEFDAGGNPVDAIGVVQNITERKERERDLELFRTLVDNASDAIYVVDSFTSELHDVNEAACRQLGYDREDLLSMSIPDFDREFDHDMWDEFAANIRDQGSNCIESVHERADGSTFPVEITIRHVSLDREYHVATAREITERKEREREHQTFREAVEAASHAIYWTDPDGTIEYVNPAFEAQTGYSAEEALGRNPRILKSGEHDQAFYENLWETICAGDVWKSKIINQRRDGEQYVVEQTITPIETVAGEIERFVAINEERRER